MDTIKKEIINFGNNVMSVPGGEMIILDSFAAIYIALRKAKNVGSLKYQLFNVLFKKLGVIPKMNEKGEIIYKERIKKENPFEKVEQKENKKKENKDFFKKKNQNNLSSKCANCEYKSYYPYIMHNSGEKELIDDILFNLEKEIGGLIYVFNKL